MHITKYLCILTEWHGHGLCIMTDEGKNELERRLIRCDKMSSIERKHDKKIRLSIDLAVLNILGCSSSDNEVGISILCTIESS